MLSFVVPTRRSLLATVVGLLLLGSGGPLSFAAPAHAAPSASRVGVAVAADIPTTTALVVEPGTVLEPFTPATFRAVVSPADAQGSVTFAANGVALGSVPVAGGQAVVASTSRPAGDYVVTGSFVPTTGTRFLGSSATPVTLLVNAVPRVMLFRTAAPVPPGTKVNVGEALTARIDGFPPQALVTFTLGALSLPIAVTTDGLGAASVAVTVPRSLPSSVYQLSASGAKRSAGFVFYVYNPGAAAVVSSPVSSLGGSVPVTRPVTTTTGTAPVRTTGGQTVPPATSGDSAAAPPAATAGGELPQTGGDTAGLLLGATLALGIGTVLTVAGRPRPAGAHSRPRRLLSR